MVRIEVGGKMKRSLKVSTRKESVEFREVGRSIP
jgi:hypothetical protein